MKIYVHFKKLYTSKYSALLTKYIRPEIRLSHAIFSFTYNKLQFRGVFYVYTIG